VIHCAVITAGAAREIADPETIVAVNIQGAVGTLMAAVRCGVRRFVYPSSGSIYGHAAKGVAVIEEDSLLPSPVMLYGLTKRAAETILPRVAETQGAHFTAARLGSVYGPWEYATGVRDTLSPMLQALECARSGKEAVLGPPWAGDYIYSRDVAAGLVRIADAPALSRTVYNLGSGQAVTVAEWCTALAPLIPGFRWRFAKAAEAYNVESHTGFDRGAFDISKMAAETGFVPQFSFTSSPEDYLAWLNAA
jgi:nucleoside-diphosphate-sugar epimerase